MIDLDAAFHRLGLSAFRRKFHLTGRELAYLETWGLPHVMKQAEDIITRRLASANPPNDGRQTPWRSHPVFVAQHATATCCRGCLLKTHEIEKGRELTEIEKKYVLRVIERWLRCFHPSSFILHTSPVMPTPILHPSIVKAAGNKPKVIEEYVGRVNSHTEAVSIARMKSPSGWVEPGQTPEFDEYTVVLRGTLRVTTKSGTLEIHAGQGVIVHAGEWVQYSTPGAEGAEYVAVCLPAFSPDAVHRDE